MIYVLNIGTITFFYIANLTCIATWPKYTIFGWGCHMELLPEVYISHCGLSFEPKGYLGLIFLSKYNVYTGFIRLFEAITNQLMHIVLWI